MPHVLGVIEGWKQGSCYGYLLSLLPELHYSCSRFFGGAIC